MSVSISRQLFSRLITSSNKKLVKSLVNVRFKSHKIEAAVLKKFSEPLQIESVDFKKKLGSKEVLIDVNCCALNGVDILVCENFYHQEHKLPFVPGYEVSGKLLKVGEEAKKAGYDVGDKVIALNKESFGGLSDLCIAEMGDVWKIPTSIKSVDAVCLLQYYMTALIGLEQYGSIAEEDIVLVNVGVGGAGLAAVDIAANVFRAKVIGVGFSEDKLDKIRERGAFHAFVYKEKKLLKELEEIAAERDIKEIFEGDSGKHFKKVLNGFMDVYKSKTPSKDLLRDDNFGVVVQHLSREGKIIIAGVGNTKSDDDNVQEQKEKENEHDEKKKEKEETFAITGISLRDYRKRNHDLYRTTGDDIITFFEEGLIKPNPSMIAGFYNVNEAVKFISDLKYCGKVVIDMKDKDREAKPNK